MKTRSLWPWVIGAALVVHVVGSLVVVAIATSDPSYAVEEDYYQKAVHWDEKRAQDRTNSDLGWGLTFEVTPPTGPGENPILETRLVDRHGEPLVGAAIALEAFHNAHSGEIVRVLLTADDAGLYSASPAMRHNGRWELRFTVDHEGDHFTYTESRHLFVEGAW